MAKKKTNNSVRVGFEEVLWKAADKLRGHMDAAEYKHVVLGLIFLKYISDSFHEYHEELTNTPNADPRDEDEYGAKNIFWVPKEARWPGEGCCAPLRTYGTPVRSAGANGERILAAGGLELSNCPPPPTSPGGRGFASVPDE